MRDPTSAGDFNRLVVMPLRQARAAECQGGKQMRAIEHGQSTCPLVSPRAKWQKRWRSGGHPWKTMSEEMHKLSCLSSLGHSKVETGSEELRLR